MGARWYNPTSANFLSRDTVFGQLSTPVSLNRYTYAVNNPLAFWDPDGRIPQSLINDEISASEQIKKNDAVSSKGAFDTASTGYNNDIEDILTQVNATPEPASGEAIETIVIFLTKEQAAELGLTRKIGGAKVPRPRRSLRGIAAGLWDSTAGGAIDLAGSATDFTVNGVAEVVAARGYIGEMTTGSVTRAAIQGYEPPPLRLDIPSATFGPPEGGEAAYWATIGTVLVITITIVTPFIGDEAIVGSSTASRAAGRAAANATDDGARLADDFLRLGDDSARLADDTELILLHGDDLIKRGSSFEYWSTQSTDDILRSLAPGGESPLTANQYGTVMDGNTRISILMDRGVSVNTLPRVPHTSGLP